MRSSFATSPGGTRPNEDWCAATPTVAVVLDGLSTAGIGTGCEHGVPWFVQRLAGRLLSASGDPAVSLRDALAEAIVQVAGLHRACDLSHGGTPSATVAILREQPDCFDYLVLADAAVVLDTPTGIREITDLRVESVAREELAETRRHAVGTAEHRASIEALISAQRKLRNTPDGYWIAAADPAAASYATVGTISGDEFLRGAVVSDGASRLVAPFALASWTEALDLMATEGPASLIDRVRAAEASDPRGERWARFKGSDDATAVLCLRDEASNDA